LDRGWLILRHEAIRLDKLGGCGGIMMCGNETTDGPRDVE
jgi:hypothetical protein